MSPTLLPDVLVGPLVCVCDDPDPVQVRMWGTCPVDAYECRRCGRRWWPR